MHFLKMVHDLKIKIKIHYHNNIRFIYFWTSSIFSPFCLNDVMQIANENNIEIGISLQSIIIFLLFEFNNQLNNISKKKKKIVYVWIRIVVLNYSKFNFLLTKPYFWTSVLFWPYLFGITNYNLSWNYQNKTFFFYLKKTIHFNTQNFFFYT